MTETVRTGTAIAGPGIVGDLPSTIPVGTEGPIDRFCCPRIASPSVFGALFDDDRGPHVRIRPVGLDSALAAAAPVPPTP
jgi:hypothetical protein